MRRSSGRGAFVSWRAVQRDLCTAGWPFPLRVGVTLRAGSMRYCRRRRAGRAAGLCLRRWQLFMLFALPPWLAALAAHVAAVHAVHAADCELPAVLCRGREA